MKKEMSQAEMYELARVGACQRLERLDAERERILGAFPDLAPSPDADARTERRQSTLTLVEHDQAAERPTRGPRKGSMTRAQRHAISERMRAYWQARKDAAARPARRRA